QIRASNDIAQVQQHFGNTAHAGAADADEMYLPDPAHPLAHAHPSPPAARHTSATSRVACGCARVRACSAMRCNCIRSCNNSCKTLASKPGLKSCCCTMRA